MERKPSSKAVSGMPQDGIPEAVLPDPLVFPNDVLAPVPAGMADDHLLLASVRNLEIPLTVQCPEPALRGDFLQLLVDGASVGNVILLDPYLGGAVPVPLPGSTRSEGLRVINYKAVYRSAGGLEQFGPPRQQFIADYTAPGGATISPLLFDSAVIVDGVTPDKLSTAPGGEQFLASIVAPYFEKAWGDHIQALLDGNAVGTPVDVPQNVSGNLELPFPRPALEAAGDGDHLFSFRVTDRAGNTSASSIAVTLEVRLSNTIPDLLPLVVPGAADGLVTDSDARVNGGVTVEIPGHAAIRTGDTIVWSWNARLSAPIPVTQNGQDPILTVTAPYAAVYDDWRAGSADSNRTVLALAGYTVSRAGAEIGSPPQLTRAPVNLFTPGGRDPDPLTPEHESLRPPSVRPAGGGPDNVIPPDAVKEDATAIIPGMTAGVPPEAAFLPGDSVQFYWNNIPVDAPFVVTTAGADVVRTVPKDVLAAHSPGTWNVHYVATRKLVMPPFENAARSPAQAVEVMDAGDVPGGGDPLRKAKWLEGPAGPGRPDHIDRDKAISNGGTPLRIYAYEGMDAGDQFHMVFQGYGNNVPGVDPIPASRYVADYTILPDDLVPRLDDSVSPPELAVFFDQNIPTSNLLLIDYGSATFDYTATNAVGSAPAEQAWIYVSTQQ